MRPRRPQPEAVEPGAEPWAAELRDAVIPELDPDLVAVTAGRAASSAAAASIATAAAIGGAATGGNTMTTASAAMTGTGTAAASLGPKVAALVVAGATITGSLAATGTLPDAAQQTAADLASVVGIELPRPQLAGLVEMVDVGTAGTVSLQVTGGVVSVTDLATGSGYTAWIEQTVDGALSVTFTSDDASLVLDAELATGGDLVTRVTEEPGSPAGTVDIPVEPEVTIEGSTGLGIGNEHLEGDAIVDLGVSLGD